MDIFLGEGKELINKIFVGHGPGSEFIIDFFIDYFAIPCEERSCVISDISTARDNELNQSKNSFQIKHPEIKF